MSYADYRSEVTDLPWRQPFEQLQHTVKLMIWTCAIFAVIISAIAISGLSIAWYSLHKQVGTNQENIIALCRELNEHNNDIRTVGLDLGVPAYKLVPFLPKPCNEARLQKDFHR